MIRVPAVRLGRAEVGQYTTSGEGVRKQAIMATKEGVGQFYFILEIAKLSDRPFCLARALLALR